MSVRTQAPIAVLLGLALAACQPQGGGSEATAAYDAPDFSTMNEAYDAAVNAGDAEAMGMLYAEDAVSMPPNAPSLVGRAAIVADAAEDFAGMEANLTSQYEGHHLMGDMVVEWGSYSFGATVGETGMEIQDDGKYVAIYQRQPDGSWQIVRDIWNSNSPIPGMEGEAESEGESE